MHLKAIQLELIEDIIIMQTLQLLYLINPMEKSPGKATSSSASQEIPCTLCKPEIRYHVHSNWPLLPILDEINPAHASPPYFFKIYFNIIAPSTIRSCKWSLHQNPECTFPLPHTCHIPPGHLILRRSKGPVHVSGSLFHYVRHSLFMARRC